MFRERFLKRTLMPLGFTTIDFTGINKRNIRLGPYGKGKWRRKVVSIKDNDTQGIQHIGIGRWVNFFDNSRARRPNLTITNYLNQVLTQKTEGNAIVIPDLDGAIAVYHGPGNKRRYKTR